MASCGEAIELKALSQPTGFFCAREIEDGCDARDIAGIGSRSPLIARAVCGLGLSPAVLEGDGNETTRIDVTAITTAVHCVILRIASSHPGGHSIRTQNSQARSAFPTHRPAFTAGLFTN